MAAGHDAATVERAAQESLDNAATLEAIAQSARQGRLVEVATPRS
jgi:hypothetical protein